MNPTKPTKPQADFEPIPNEDEERDRDIAGDHLDEPKQDGKKLPVTNEELKDLANDAEGG